MRCFVYGSLRPGEYNYDRVGGSSHDPQPGTISGRLYDTGWGYPQAKLDEEGTIIGDVVYFGNDNWKHIVSMEEGAGYEMHEVTVTFADGSTATHAAWHYKGIPHGNAVESGDWLNREDDEPSGAVLD